ncbi:MAG: hydroxyacylglutathione hydrolase [Sphingobacteriales bacterium]|jgi:hydroxyacylglutathione hydrolase
MFIEQMYTNCLAEAAYFVVSEGEAIVIDPLRETEPYISKADEMGVKIKYIFETHFHADFVSGHIDLAKKTGAKIVYGPNANTNYDTISAKDEEIFEVGKIKIKVLHTPGHTLESSTYLLIDENGKEHCIFSGDTLFIGDVGRPDLAIKSDLTAKDLAGMLYDSLREKIMPLPNDVIVFPAHGAGSSCGKNMSKETFDTLGHQKETNYALSDISKEEFVEILTEGIMPAPGYFAQNASLNKNGYDSIDQVMENGLTPLSVSEFEKKISEGVFVLDTRHQTDFHKGFIPGSVFIGLDGMFAVWVGTVIEKIDTPMIVVTPEGREEETIKRLARVGYDNVMGFLNGGFEAWAEAGKPVDALKSITPEEFENHYTENEIHVVDVRKPSEYEGAHVTNSELYPLDFILENLNKLNKSDLHYVHCAGGYRSMIAASILRKQGYKDLIDVQGGFGKIKTTKIPLTSPELA